MHTSPTPQQGANAGRPRIFLLALALGATTLLTGCLNGSSGSSHDDTTSTPSAEQGSAGKDRVTRCAP